MYEFNEATQRYELTAEQLKHLLSSQAGNRSRDAYQYMMRTGCTQVEAAKMFNVSQPALSKYVSRHGAAA